MTNSSAAAAAGSSAEAAGSDGELPDDNDLKLSETDRRELVAWTVECAERLLPLFVEKRPDDTRPQQALEAAWAFLRGEMSIDAVRERAFACHAAAREVDDPAASAAARVCGQAVGVAHMAGHSRQVPRHTARAFRHDPARRHEELTWQRERIPARFEHYVYEGD
ncbi:putative immunity protein [Microbacterium sp. YY-01]|uniref:putative immunity protein n=1 Tax=Microbacterium sp. YY-01 TaxID=3421634 RepID=UPI003D165021